MWRSGINILGFVEKCTLPGELFVLRRRKALRGRTGVKLAGGLAVLTVLAGCGSKVVRSPGELTELSGKEQWEQAGREAEEAGTGPEEGKTLKVGGAVPLTGGASEYGTAIRDGAELAVREINEAGGVNGCQVILCMEDDGADPQKAAEAYDALKGWGAQLLVGGVTNSACEAFGELAAADGIFYMIPGATGSECLKGASVYRLCLSDRGRGEAAAEYLAKSRPGAKVALFYDDTDSYLSDVYEGFCGRAQELGLEITAAQRYTFGNECALAEQCAQAKASGAELLVLALYYEGAQLVQQALETCAPQMEVLLTDDVTVLTEHWRAEGEPENMLYIQTSGGSGALAREREFAARYQESGGARNERYAAQGYEAMKTTLEAAASAGITADMDCREIALRMAEAMEDFCYQGIEGEICWNGSGDASVPLQIVKTRETE